MSLQPDQKWGGTETAETSLEQTDTPSSFKKTTQDETTQEEATEKTSTPSVDADTDAAKKNEEVESTKDSSTENQTRGAPSEEETTSKESANDKSKETSQSVSESDAKTALRAEKKSTALTSSDLSKFLTDVKTNLTPGEDGTYTVEKGKTFSLDLTFQEVESLQMNDTESLTYTIPEGITLNGTSGTFDIQISDEQGDGTVKGNTYRINDGVLTVNFNQNDPNFSRLQSEANVGFSLNFNAELNGNASDVKFIDSVTLHLDDKKPESNVTVTKDGKYDAKSGVITYQIVVTSSGENTNVTVEDTISGTALIYQKDVSGSSSKSGALNISASNTENGYTYVIPSMSDGEKVTLTYTAKVNYDKLSGEGRGTKDETNNTVKVTSTEDPDGDEKNKDFTNQIQYRTLSKVAGDTKTDASGNTVVPWTVTANNNQQISLAGQSITDTIDKDSQTIMHYSGKGIKIIVTKEDGTKEEREVSWADLTTETDSQGMISWRYQVPSSDGKYSYQISYETTVDTSSLITNTSIKNLVTDGKISTSGSKDIGIGEGEQFNVKKEVTESNSQTVSWKVTVHVPKSGLNSLTVTDTLPHQWIDGKTYLDTLVDGSVHVKGLTGTESYQEESMEKEGLNYLVLTFYQDNAKTKSGLSSSDSARDLVITFQTNNNPEWMEKYEKDRVDYYKNHTNNVTATANKIDKSDSATATPAHESIKKSLTKKETVQIDGVSYPVYSYKLVLENVTTDTIDISDEFNTEYLKYYEDRGIVLKGGDIYGQYYSDGGSATISSTKNGMNIHVSAFPKGNNSFYSVYSLEYSLIVKDAEALKALEKASIDSTDGVKLKNIATWGANHSEEVTVDYKYDALDKELVTAPSKDNNYRATYQITINQDAEDLLAGADELTLTDKLSDNLRLIEDSVVIHPENNTTYTYKDHTLTVKIPDATKTVITYDAYVTGKGNQTYTNTATLEGYTDHVEQSVTVESSGSGSGSNPYIDIHKVSAEDHKKSLAGATYQLYRYDSDGNKSPVVDNNGENVTFTTDDEGKARIIGNQNTLGWVLWKDSRYALVEIKAPEGYKLSEDSVDFTISDNLSTEDETTYYTGSTITVTDKVQTTDISGSKTWEDNNNQDGARPDSITIRLLANGEEVTSKEVTADDKWAWNFKDLPKYENGEKITYTITEDAVKGYSAEVSGYDVTNTHTPGKTSVAVTKAWSDSNDQDGKRPDSVTVHLLADGEDTGKTVELNGANNWSGTFTDLDAKKAGKLIVYTVEEAEVAGYTAVITGDATTGFTVTNTHETETTSISGAKTWSDNDNQDGTRPNSITIHLLANGKEVRSKEVTADDKWAWNFEGLPKYENGEEITYTITEDAVEGYSAEVSGYDVTNTHTPGKTSVAVTKAWDDNNNQDGKRPINVTVRLLADGEDTGKIVELNEANNWSDTFTDLDEKKAGKAIAYTVEETEVAGYTTTITGDIKTGFTVTNTHETETTSISGAKTWDDNNNQDGARPERITIRLLANGTEVDHKDVTAKDGWKYKFTDLAKYENGKEISYMITEDAVVDYTTTVNGNNVTNTHIPGKTTIHVSKSWNDNNNQDGKRPKNVTIHLLADGKDTGKILTLTESDQWVGSFSDLDVYSNGEKIVYTVSEDAVSDYEISITGDAKKGFIVTNTHKTETVKVNGSKTWKDNNNQDGKRPASITVQLMQTTKNGTTTVASKKVTADSNGNWKYSFENLPKYEKGELITYSIGEEAVEDYTLTVKGYDLINSYTPDKTSIYVAKVWNDEQNKDKIRPKSIIVHLLADGKDTGKTVMLNADNGWNTSFKDLAAYSEGKMIHYTVSEESVAGYTTEITGDSKKGFVITNTHTLIDTKKPTNTPTKQTTTTSPKTGDSSNIILYGTLLMSAIVALLILLSVNRKKKSN